MAATNDSNPNAFEGMAFEPDSQGQNNPTTQPLQPAQEWGRVSPNDYTVTYTPWTDPYPAYRLWVLVPQCAEHSDSKKGWVNVLGHNNLTFLNVLGQLLVDTAKRNTLDSEPKITAFTTAPYQDDLNRDG